MAASPYDSLIQEAADKYKLDPVIFRRVIERESGFNPRAVSPKGARGLGQFMPETGRKYGLVTDEDFFNPNKSIDASARHLSDLKAAHGGYPEALTAYNASWNNGKYVQAVREGRFQDIPMETQKYISFILQGSGNPPVATPASKEEFGKAGAFHTTVVRHGPPPDVLLAQAMDTIRAFHPPVGFNRQFFPFDKATTEDVGPDIDTDKIMEDERNRLGGFRRREGVSPSYVEGFVKTALHGMGPGLVGMHPSDAVAAFGAEHPYSAFAADMAGMLVPYGVGAKVGLKLASKLPVISRAAKYSTSVENVARHPAKMAAIREMVRFTPFEMARVAGAMALPTGDPGQVMREALFELPLFGGIAGIGKKLVGAHPLPVPVRGREARIASVFPEFETMQSPQVKLDKIHEILKTADPEKLGNDLMADLYTARRELRAVVHKQTPPPGRAFFKKFVGDRGRAKAQSMNELLNNKYSGIKAMLWPDVRETAADEFAVKLLPDDPDALDGLIQYPRLLRPRDADESKRLRVLLRDKMNKVGSGPGDNMFMAQEVDGIWVMAKRLKGRTLEARDGDEFLIWKTNNPGKFDPAAVSQGHRMVKGAFHTQADAVRNSIGRSIPVLAYVRRLSTTLIDKDLKGQATSALASKMDEWLSPELQHLRKDLVAGMTYYGEMLKSVFAATLHETGESPLAGAIMNIARAAHGFSHARLQAIAFGRPKKLEGSLFGAVFGKVERERGVLSYIDEFTEEEIKQVHKAHDFKLTPSEMRSKGYSNRVVEFFRRAQTVQKNYDNEMLRLGELIGDQFLHPTEFHNLMTRTWRGDFRLPIHEVMPDGTPGAMVAVASGSSRQAALQEAVDVAAKMYETNPTSKLMWRKDAIAKVGRDEDLELAANIINGGTSQAWQIARRELIEATPPRLKPRHGVAGYMENPTRSELKSMILSNLIGSERIITSRALKYELKPLVDRLLEDFPHLGPRVIQRINALAGVPGKGAVAINKFTDTFLAPVLGRNSATRIAKAVNETMFHLTFGLGDIGFGIINAMTPIQTLLPELSLVLNTPPQRLAKHLGWDVAIGRNGVISVGSMSVPQIMKTVFKSLAHPEEELKEAIMYSMERASLAPRLVEEFIGEKAHTIANWRKVLSGDESLSEFLLALNTYIPAKSEEFTRMVSYVAGWHLGRDFLKFEGEKLAAFAEQIVARSNFLYSAADRSRITTGALGQMFGLYKNWSTHYLGNMMNYAGEAFLHGNFRPLLWQTSGTFTMAGVGGLPLYALADGFSKMASDKSLMENLYTAFGHRDLENTGDDSSSMADFVFYGFPALGGVALQSRTSAIMADPMRDISFLFSSATLDRGAALFDAVGEGIQHSWATGQNPLYNKEIRDKLYAATLPRTVARALTFTGENAMKSVRTGNRIISDINFPQRLSHIMGVTPLDIEKAHAMRSILYEETAHRQYKTSSYGSALAEATLRKDYQEQIAILRQAMFHGGVDPASVVRSMRSHLYKMNSDGIERAADAYRAYQLGRSLNSPTPLSRAESR